MYPMIAHTRPALVCNGHSQLCERRYNEVAYAAAHNAQSYKLSAVNNQDQDITQQLKNGIRAMKIPVWYDKNDSGKCVPFACHGMDKSLVHDAYLGKLIDKVPRLFRPFARDIFNQLKPVDELVRDALTAAYGEEDKQGVIPFKHCILDPARKPLNQLLAEICCFLDTNQHEVVTLILEDFTKNLDEIADCFKESKMIKYVHAQNVNKQWPTLAQMINSGKRLVVLLQADAALSYNKYPWMHYIWDFAWDTQWDFQRTSDLHDINKDIMPLRGLKAFDARGKEPKNKLFIVHHFITPMTGGDKNCAKRVNRKSVLKRRLDKLAQKAGHIPNIIQVDFFQYPNKDIFDVVNELNGINKRN